MRATPSHDDGEVRAHVVAVASALDRRLADVTSAMRDVLASRIAELNGDVTLIDLLGASIEGNVDNILYSLQHDVTVDRIEPPSAAFEYARRLAQRGVPVNALVRAYRLGQQNLLEAAYTESQSRGDNACVQSRAYERIVTVTFGYIDWISQHVVSVYEDERERWLADRNTMRTARVEEIIAGGGGDVDASEAAIGYRLRGWHLGAVAWVDETGARQDQLSRFTSCLTAITDRIGVGRPPLVIARDRASVWAWIPVAGDFTLDAGLVSAILRGGDGPPAPVVALGSPRQGLAGFRQTHLEAVQAQRVGVVSSVVDGPLISYGEPGVGVVALLTHDLAETRRWVCATLCGLARDDDHHERLRDTLRLFLRHNRSYTATAEAMLMHKNSVKYRILSAEKELGRPVSADPQAIELALTVCRWIGSPVLAEPLG